MPLPPSRAFSTALPKQKTTAQIWLGDAGAWPVIGVLGGECPYLPKAKTSFLD